MIESKNLPAPLRQVWKPMWLVSLGVHGMLLAIPIPTEQQSKPVVEEKPEELVRLTQIETSPGPVTVAPEAEKERLAPRISRRSPRKPTVATKPQPTLPAKPAASKPSPAVVSPRPQQQPVAIAPFSPQSEIEIDPQKQELLPPPQEVASPTPSPEIASLPPSLDVAVSPSPNSKPIAVADIQGIPIDPTWQAVEQPTQAIAAANMFVQADGKPYPDIVGQIAQVPNKNPDVVFEEFFRPQLESANFQVEPFGTYAPGGGLYKLTPKGSTAAPLYLTLAPDKQGTGTIVTIWKKYPSSEE